MSEFIAIDPGPKVSAWLWWNGERAVDMAIEDNEQVLRRLRRPRAPIVCEMVASYGMAVGKDVFETVYWIGRFCQAAETDRVGGVDHDWSGPGHHRVFRKDVKMHLCGSMRAKDANIRQALIDRFPATGGGKTPQIGTKAQPGPLYGMKSHLWAALAVAVYHSDTTIRDAA